MNPYIKTQDAQDDAIAFVSRAISRDRLPRPSLELKIHPMCAAMAIASGVDYASNPAALNLSSEIGTIQGVGVTYRAPEELRLSWEEMHQLVIDAYRQRGMDLEPKKFMDMAYFRRTR